MKAMVLRPQAAGGLELAAEERPLPVPGPGQVRIRVAACGVCRTDLHQLDGELPHLHTPRIPGHQVVGQVDALGEGVASLSPGERVGVAWLAKACGLCAACRRGQENLCPQAQFTGYTVDGGYAETLLAEAPFVYPIPDGIADAEAAPLLCAGIIGYRSLRLSDAEPGERVGLFGFGASAHLTLPLARALGMEVHVFSRGGEHRRLARELGASWVGEVGQGVPGSLDRAILFAPSGALVPAILHLLRPGGTLAINAIHMDDLPPLPYSLLYGERTLRSVTNATRQDGIEFLRLAAEHHLRPRISRFPLAEAGRALEAVRQSALQGAAVLVP